MRQGLAWKNILVGEGFPVTPTSQEAALPGRWALDPMRSKPWYSAEGEAAPHTLFVDCLTPQTAGFVAAIGLEGGATEFSAAATNDADWSTQLMGVSLLPGLGPYADPTLYSAVLDEPVTARYWRLDVSGGDARVGLFYASPLLIPRPMRYDWQEGVQEATEAIANVDGATFLELGPSRRTFSLSFRLFEEDRAALEAARKVLKIGVRAMFLLDVDDVGRTVYGALSRSLSYAAQYSASGTLYEVPIEFQEEC